jgi:hypothetical protein
MTQYNVVCLRSDECMTQKIPQDRPRGPEVGAEGGAGQGLGVLVEIRTNIAREQQARAGTVDQQGPGLGVRVRDGVSQSLLPRPHGLATWAEQARLKGDGPR